MSTKRGSVPIVDESGVIDMLHDWREQDGYNQTKGGRPNIISQRSALILMCMVAIEEEAVYISKASEIICHRANQDVLRKLGLPDRDSGHYNDSDSLKVWYHRLYRTWKTMQKIMDPRPDLFRGKRLTKSMWADYQANEDADFVRTRTLRLFAYSNALLIASTQLLPEQHRQWNGDVVLDGTPFVAARIGSAARSSRVSSEPEAWWYRRGGDHMGSEKSKVMWAYEVTYVAQTFGKTDSDVPSLIVGMSMDTPGHQPHERAVDAVQHLIDDPSIPKGYLMGDRLYQPGGMAEKFAIPMREGGYRLISDQTSKSLGVQGEYKGAQLIDGNWYVPGMPAAWANASQDYHDGKITAEQLEEYIDRRQAYAFIVKFVGKC